MNQRIPSRGHAIRESSGPGSAEAMDLLDSIYPNDVQRVGTASTAANGGINENGSASIDGPPPGGLMSVPEDQQLSHAQIQAANAQLLDTSRQASVSFDDFNTTDSSSRLGSSVAGESIIAEQAHSSKTHAEVAAEEEDVFGPTSVIKPQTRRTPSSSSVSRRSASDTTTASAQRSPSFGKPLPGIPGFNVENTSLPLSSQSPPDLASALAALQNGPSSLPPQQIPRPVNNDFASNSAILKDVPQVLTNRNGDLNESLQDLDRRDLLPAPISKETFASTAQRSYSPQESGRIMAERDRSSIDDIRRLHAQRAAARNLEASSAGGNSDQQSTNVRVRGGGMTSQRPLSVIEPRSRDAALSAISALGSSSRDSAFARPKSSDAPRGSRGAVITSASNAPMVERANESEREKERESRERDKERERDKDRDRERDRERERRTRRTLGDYAFGKTLGAGSMGKVKLGVKMGNGEKVAIKIIPRHTSLAAAQHPRQPQNGEKPAPPPTASFLAKAAAKDHSKEVRTIREGSLQLLLHHPYVCGMREMIIHPNHYYMIFEYVNGGQMLDYIISHGRLRERAARKFARQIGSALEYCHRNSIVHRDLKIENILISKTGNIKIIDFGLSNLFSPHSHLSTFCGSLYFAAPELLNAKAYVGPEVDVWSFGIVLYVLVCGKVPFDDQSMPALHAKIKKGQVEYPAWLSGECKHILSRMLVTNPQQRATLPEILAHPWMIKGYDGAPNAHLTTRQPLRPQTLDPEVLKGMTGFEFGTPEDIESRLLEILTGEAYQNALQAWESKASGFNPVSASPSNTGSTSDMSGINALGRTGTRGSVDMKQKTGSKRFSGIDFYRKKISSNSLFGSKDDSNTLNGHNGNLNGNVGLGGPWPGAGKESLDPTRGFHPLISIYYLVSEKMEREKLYGHSFFASSNVSLTGQQQQQQSGIAMTSTRDQSPLKQANHNDGAGGSSSMPTAADIPQEALRIPEVSHVATASRREGPVPSLPAPPASARTSGSSQPITSTPVFDSREKSQPMPIMSGPPRPRAHGDEVEAALREKGYPAPLSTSWNPGTGAEQRMGPSQRASMLPSNSAMPAEGAKRSLSLSAGNRGKLASNGSHYSPAITPLPSVSSQKQQEVAPPPPLEKDVGNMPRNIRKNSKSPDKRRSLHGLLSPRLDVPSGSASTVEGGAEGAAATSVPQNASFLSRRFSSFIGRSPSTPVDMDGREKRRQARLSTAGTSATPPLSRSGSVHIGSLAGVEESQAGENRANQLDDVPLKPAEEADQATGMRQSNTQQGMNGQRRDSYQRTLTPSATVGRSGGNQMAPLGASRRPNTGQASLISEGEPTNSNQLELPRSSNGSGAQRSATITIGSRQRHHTPIATNIPTFGERDTSSHKPIFLKGLFSVQTTTTKPRAVLHADLVRVFDRIGLQYRELKGGYECVHLPSLDFSNSSGRGNARITGGGGGEEDVGVNERLSNVDAVGEPQSNGVVVAEVEGNSTLSRPRRKQSRMSFLGSKKDKQKKAEGVGMADSESIGSFNNASTSIGDDLASKNGGRSRASSITAHTREDQGEGLEQIQTMSPSSQGNKVNHRIRTDSLGAPSFMQSPTQSPSTAMHSPLMNTNNSASLSPTTPNTMVAISPSPSGGGNGGLGQGSTMNAFALELAVRFEIYVVKVPLLLGVNGLQFRRISGNPWQYQQLARRVLQELKVSPHLVPCFSSFV